MGEDVNYDAKQGVQGGIGGAMAGGSVGGPWGAVIGGGLGLLTGFASNETDDERHRRQLLMQYYTAIRNRPADPGIVERGERSGIRERQISLIDQLEAQSRGQGPSLAEQQLRSATDRNVSQQAGMANSGRGGPMATIVAQNNMAHLGARASQDSAAARIQEQQNARQLLGLNLHGVRGADEEMSRFNVSVAQQNMWARLKQMGMNDEAALRTLELLGGQNSQLAGRTGLGEQVMAGGAGMYAQSKAQGGGGSDDYNGYAQHGRYSPNLED